MVFVVLHSLLRLLIFKHLIVKEKSLYETPPSHLSMSQKKKALFRWGSPWAGGEGQCSWVSSKLGLLGDPISSAHLDP